MVKTIIKIASVFLILTTCLSLSSCSKKDNTSDSLTAICSNGHFIGIREDETGVISFKGIPYAKSPVGELRWKAPCEPDDSDEEYTAYTYGKSSIQYYWHSEPIETEVGEDCLTLNVWTKDLSVKGKTVMVFLHGGAYAWGGTSEPYYDAQYIVAAHSDVVVVTCNYRLGIMGFANFNGIAGCEDFPDAQNLGYLDVVMALKWVQNNIETFGGDPENVTIFGESAGAGMATALLSSDNAGVLFNRAIIESGSANIVFSKELSADYNRNVVGLMALTGAENMDDLMALSEKELIEANEAPLDEDGTTVNDLYLAPIRGVSGIAEDIYEAILNGQSKDVDVLIGTNLNEMNYWVNEMGDYPMTEMSEEEQQLNLYLYENYFIRPLYESVMETVSEQQQADLEEYLSLHSDKEELWAISDMLGDLYYRSSSITVAQNHSLAGGIGKTYMYLFERENEEIEYYGAAHAAELPYVFLDPSGLLEESDSNLMNNVCASWVNFAKTGNPSSENIIWTEYNTEERNTMIIGNDGSMAMESDPYGRERELLSSLMSLYLLPSGS